MAAFYRDVVGMTVVTELPADSHMGATMFLARHPDEHEHHDLVFFSNPVFAHTAFEVASLAELLTAHREVKEKGVPIKFTFNHGFWLSFYFDDPEGHNIEFFWRTGVWVPNDFQVMPINLERPEEEIMHDVELLREHFAGGTRTTAAGTPVSRTQASEGRDNRTRANRGQVSRTRTCGMRISRTQDSRMQASGERISRTRANGEQVSRMPVSGPGISRTRVSGTRIRVIRATGTKWSSNSSGLMAEKSRCCLPPCCC